MAAPAGQQTQQSEVAIEDGQSTTFTNAGAIPPVQASTQPPPATASDLAYGAHSPLPLTTSAGLTASADKIEIERLLKSGSVTSGQDAIAALNSLLQMDHGERVSIVDRLDDRAFANLLDRLTDDQRARFTPIVEAAQDPKRRLKLWAAQHASNARNDLERYDGDFGGGDGSATDAQIAAHEKYQRREAGVESTEHEIATETDALLRKKDLSVADVDAMRARKDRELDVEIKHNVNLVAEERPRADGSAVQWSKDEATQLDQALDNVPRAQSDGEKSVTTFTRRANRQQFETRGGQYQNKQIDIYDHAHDRPPGREQARPVEYAAVHEIGHDAAHDNPEAFQKFETAAGWHQAEGRCRESGRRV